MPANNWFVWADWTPEGWLLEYSSNFMDCMISSIWLGTQYGYKTFIKYIRNMHKFQSSIKSSFVLTCHNKLLNCWNVTTPVHRQVSLYEFSVSIPVNGLINGIHMSPLHWLDKQISMDNGSHKHLYISLMIIEYIKGPLFCFFVLII